MKDERNEIWVSIFGYSDKYEVSNFGRVRSLDREVNGGGGGRFIKKGKILKDADDGSGYRHVVLYDNNLKTKTFKIHKLVASAFIPNPLNKETVNHKDGIKHNNNVSNLEWATRSENTKHKYIIGLDTNEGEKHPCSKLKEHQVLEIRERYCNGETDRVKLGIEYGISPSHVFSIAKKISWRHI